MLKSYRCLYIIFLMIFTCFIYSLNSQKDSIGLSLNKRSIDLYRFGTGKDIVIIIAGIHGDEKNTVQTAYSFIDFFTNNEGKIPQNKSVWIIPDANPDGTERGCRLNDNDVDLNRNFDTSDWRPDFYFYNVKLSAGSKPFSEPETQNLKTFFESVKNRNVFVISLHSAGNAVIPADDDYSNRKLAHFIQANSGYCYGGNGYKASGDLTGWVYEKLRMPAVTIEFKTSDEDEFDKLFPAIDALLKSDFGSMFYSGKDTGTANPDDISGLIQGLPEKTVDLIKASEDEKNRFIKLYNSIRNDEELLLLVNKTHYLSKDYEPPDLVDVSGIFPANKNSVYLRRLILPDLQDMSEKAKMSNVRLFIVSGYRSYEVQKAVFNGWKAKYGEEEARRISALPGSSQHQLGTTIDFNSLEQSFEKTREGLWLFNNAYKYGFVLSYPKGEELLTGYEYEPWHYRYIGKNASFMVYHYFDNLLEVFLNWYWSKKSW